MIPRVSKSIGRIEKKLKDTALFRPSSDNDAGSSKQKNSKSNAAYDVNSEISEYLSTTAITLMMDDFEIVCWVKFIDRFTL